MTRSRPVVAIDGPAGVGKTTVTQRLATALGYLRLDSGALYRCVALACQQREVPWADAEAVGAVARQLVSQSAIHLSLAPGGQQIQLDGRDASEAVRSQQVGLGASQVSAYTSVREALLELQRQLGRPGGVVIEGRDIGTVIFPDAEVKFFLTATLRARAERRQAELLARGGSDSLAQVEQELRQRDQRDTERPLAPLAQAPDAELVDSSSLSIDAVLAQMLRRVRTVEAQLGRGR